MLPQSNGKNENGAPSEYYRVKRLASSQDAQRITDFFLSDNAFDDTNFTPGEIIQMKSLPHQSLQDSGFQFWYEENQEHEIIGVISLRENEQKSGGYLIDYFAVHKQYRNRGIALQLMDVAIEYVQLLKGRYIHVNTCDTFLYQGVRKLFEKKGFLPVGYLADYYFEGEGMITYYKRM